ncbi:hypothetical protein SAMN05444156_1910 [Verrucomicrobium sp. GAS474]|uniref:hypothetical protein n=1 Tax=Verrucomicrobium sp. GAS474 TaxID=1882831 RepID=UPI00087B882E|nr:hypothetical protein [Verrucomicrobium sp. GAS474]SDU09220.1 hypothetical protein SAMN05444156_1910 [Verrucomicrobium sp. GAS474]
MAALLRLVTGSAIAVGALFLFSRLGMRAPMLKSRPFVLLVLLPLALIVIWAVKKAMGERED